MTIATIENQLLDTFNNRGISKDALKELMKLKAIRNEMLRASK